MTGLVGWWPLHENSGGANDLSGNGNHGTLNGGVTQGVAGKAGLTAYSFDGKDDTIITSNPVISDGGPQRATVSIWCRSKVRNNNAIISEWESGTNSNQAYNVMPNSYRDNFGLLIRQSNDNTATSGVPIDQYPLDEWFHYVGVILPETGELKSYINGKLVNHTEEWDGTFGGSNRLTISGDDGADPFEGSIADIRLYNRILTPQEIQTLYEWGSGDYTNSQYHNGSDSGAVSRWKFDGDVTDSWGSNDGSDNTSVGYSSNAIRGQAKSFDGSDDYVDSTLSLSGDFAISFWMKPDDLSKEYCPLSKDSVIFVTKDYNGDSRFDEMQFGYKDSSGSFNDVRIGPLLPTEWVHIAGVYRSGTGEMYLNGVKKGEISHTYSEQGTDLEIGRYQQSSNREFNGKIDDVRIYNRALQPHEVFQLYQWGTRGRDMRKLTVNSR